MRIINVKHFFSMFNSEGERRVTNVPRDGADRPEGFNFLHALFVSQKM